MADNKTDQIIIGSLALANMFAQIAAIYFDQAKMNGATPEQIKQYRDDAVARLDKSAEALANDPPLVFPNPQS